MLTEKIILNDQEVSDNHYQFFGVPIVCTPAFRDTFGEDHILVAFAAQQMIAEKYPDKNWDYLQTFTYKGISFWCIADADQKEHWEDEHITFLMPSDYQKGCGNYEMV